MMPMIPFMRPLVGISPDAEAGKLLIAPAYARLVARAGGVPVMLAHEPTLIPEYLNRCAAFVLTGGDDPVMERWGVSTHPKAKPLDPARQEFDLALLAALDAVPDKPLLGICLGMQLMALHAGGAIDQHLPESRPDLAPNHWGRTPHPVTGGFNDMSLSGLVESHHRQAVTDAGRLSIVATAPDGVIEAVADPAHRFALGVQWHPERTVDPIMGEAIFKRLIASVGDASSVQR